MISRAAASNEFEIQSMYWASFGAVTSVQQFQPIAGLNMDWAALYQHHERWRSDVGITFGSNGLWQEQAVGALLTANRSTELVEASTRWLSYVDQRLRELGDDGQGPNGYPARDPEIIQRAWDCAVQWFEVNTPTPSVVPTVDGGVEF